MYLLPFFLKFTLIRRIGVDNFVIIVKIPDVAMINSMTVTYVGEPSTSKKASNEDMATILPSFINVSYII